LVQPAKWRSAGIFAARTRTIWDSARRAPTQKAAVERLPNLKVARGESPSDLMAPVERRGTASTTSRRALDAR
jgi:hypothetical protein